MQALRNWLANASTLEQDALAEAAGTSRRHLWQLAGGHRKPSAGLAARIERASAAIARNAKGRLPKLLRSQLSPVCAECEYAPRCPGFAPVAHTNAGGDE
jgi:transcriptional regulator with XRE-family HTH domain